jgi:hypothetical protein
MVYALRRRSTSENVKSRAQVNCRFIFAPDAGGGGKRFNLIILSVFIAAHITQLAVFCLLPPRLLQTELKILPSLLVA